MSWVGVVDGLCFLIGYGMVLMNVYSDVSPVRV